MPAIKFRTTDYSAASGVAYSDLLPDAISFSSDRSDFSIQVNSYSDLANIVDPGSLKRIRSTTNIKRTSNISGVVLNERISGVDLPIQNVPNWASTLSINFGDVLSAVSFDVTSAILTASGAGLAASPFEESQATGSIQIHLFEISHTSTSTGVAGSGSSSWSYLDHQSKASTFNLTRNPGPSGAYSAIGSTGIPAKQHDWHVGMCVKPLQINTTPFIAFTCIIEYL